MGLSHRLPPAASGDPCDTHKHVDDTGDTCDDERDTDDVQRLGDHSDVAVQGRVKSDVGDRSDRGNHSVQHDIGNDEQNRPDQYSQTSYLPHGSHLIL